MDETTGGGLSEQNGASFKAERQGFVPTTDTLRSKVVDPGRARMTGFAGGYYNQERRDLFGINPSSPEGVKSLKDAAMALEALKIDPSDVKAIMITKNEITQQVQADLFFTDLAEGSPRQVQLEGEPSRQMTAATVTSQTRDGRETGAFKMTRWFGETTSRGFDPKTGTRVIATAVMQRRGSRFEPSTFHYDYEVQTNPDEERDVHLTTKGNGQVRSIQMDTETRDALEKRAGQKIVPAKPTDSGWVIIENKPFRNRELNLVLDELSHTFGLKDKGLRVINGPATLRSMAAGEEIIPPKGNFVPPFR